MEDVFTILMQRRSVRAFTDQQVPDESIDAIVQAGLHAATAMNRQSWHITVVQDAALLKQISAAVAQVLIDSEIPSLMERGNNPDFSVFHHAPTVLFVSGDGSHYSQADCANASQNMCLAASALHLGSCYIGSFVQAFDHDAGKSLLTRFSLPEGYRPVFAVAIGYADQVPVLSEAPRDFRVTYIR
jgi:nitroreductase